MPEQTDISIETNADIEGDEEEPSSVFGIASFIKIERIDGKESHSKTTSSNCGSRG